MPFSSGVFSLFTPGNPVVTGTTISSTAFNSTATDIATGLSTAVLKDGTQVCTASVPFAQGINVGSSGFILSNAGTLTSNLRIATQSIVDANGNEYLKFSNVASAVNDITFRNAATGNAPFLIASGGDANVGLNIASLGNGTVRLITNSADAQVQVNHVSAADRVITLQGGTAGANSAIGTSSGGLDINSTPVTFSGISTTASAANAFLDSGAANSLLRSTSSLRYKHDILPVTDEEVEAAMSLNPITYRSKSSVDDPNRRWFGFIAEDAHEKQPMLVAYSKDEDGEPIPDGFQYDRMCVVLLAKVKDLESRLIALEP